jgi:hypothetical protein
VPRLRDETEVLLGCVMACATWRAGAFFRGPTPTELKMKKYTREGGCCGSLAANQPGRGGGGGGGLFGAGQKIRQALSKPKKQSRSTAARLDHNGSGEAAACLRRPVRPGLRARHGRPRRRERPPIPLGDCSSDPGGAGVFFLLQSPRGIAAANSSSPPSSPSLRGSLLQFGGSYNHPQHGSRLRISDQQLFTYVVIMLTTLLLLLHPTSPSRDRDRDRQTGSEATTSLLLSPCTGCQ